MIDQENIKKFNQACSSGDLDLIKYLIGLGLEIKGDSGFQLAIECGELLISDYLLELYSKKNIKIYWDQALYNAIRGIGLKSVKYLLENQEKNKFSKEDINNAMTDAYWMRDKEIIEYMEKKLKMSN